MPGQVNDSLSYAIPGVLQAMGGECVSRGRAADWPTAVASAIADSGAPLVVMSGGTAHGPADPIRDALRILDADIVLDGLDVRPGRSVLLAVTDELAILSLPGNPFAALIDTVLLGWPLLAGGVDAAVPSAKLCVPHVPGADTADRVVACREDDCGELYPVAHQRASMLRGFASATHIVVMEKGGSRTASGSRGETSRSQREPDVNRDVMFARGRSYFSTGAVVVAVGAPL